jgi:phosphatidate cytidylyltransferase
MLKVRVLTASILGGLLLAALFLLPARTTVLVFGAIVMLGAWEWAAFGGLQGALARGGYALGVAVLMLCGWLVSGSSAHMLVLLSGACIWWVIAFLWVSLAPGCRQPPLALGCGALVLVPAFVALARLQVAGRADVGGAQIVLWLLLLVFAADIGAFFAGRSFGRLQLAPQVSPAKTWEGALGGLVAVAVVSWIGALRFRLPVLGSVMFGCAVGIFSIVGDLTESMFKRSAGLKDSGSLLPGHGGVLDRIDSVSAAAPLYALGLYGYGVLA